MTNHTSPKHLRATHFKKTGLFECLETFAELESRIVALPRTERGDAFEVFVETYLSTQKQVQAVEVWPGNSTPMEIRQQLGLPTSDMGVDGVFRDNTGSCSVYQAKFRTGRPSLSWTELSTFFGLSDSADTRVLITNCSKLAKVVESRSGFYCVRGSDLDRLDKRDFELICDWLRGVEVERKPKTPWAHQQQAIEAISQGLKTSDRATAVMACGTGKTLVALWLAETLKYQQILVLVPSLSLMRQTLHTWLQETSMDRISYRCVCSDATVSKGLDELTVHQSDLDFPVNTSSEEVAEYLAQSFEGLRVVFSTYQSAHVVGDALQGRELFELGIFDEAHKTAGRQGTQFSFALDDNNIPIKKRVFLTATPRHYNVSQRDKEGDAKLVYSMDVEETYGPMVHTLSFAKAAELGIICGYKVVISVVTTEMVTDALQRRGEVLVEGEAIKTRQVANQIALEQAIDKHDVNRIFTFHSTVASAKSFVAVGGEGIGSHLPELSTYHVNGKLATATREDILRDFSHANRGLVSNARCLTEGVDLPAVDMIAFMSPKKSKVDIVQATGRAMRKDPGNPKKETGLVLLPLFVESSQDESLEEALKRTDFDEVWNVLEAMQEQDEVLAMIIQQMQVDKGRSGGFDDSRFREIVEVLGPSIAIDQLREGIVTRCIERLASTWDLRYGELRNYKAEHGDCNVSQGWPENTHLGIWVNRQRLDYRNYRNNTLSPDRVERLEAIGFDWNPRESQWEQSFSELKIYRAVHGDCNVSYRNSEYLHLGRWNTKQRDDYKKNKLSADRIERLEAIGFDWNPIDSQWEQKFSELQSYKAEHGDCYVPKRYSENPQLGRWVIRMRYWYKNGKLIPDQVKILEAIGFDWNPYDSTWEKRLSELQSYKDVHGDCNVPYKWPENPQLISWRNNQRENYKRNKLSPDQIERLEAIGFKWNRLDSLWEQKFSELQNYKAAQGDCNVPQGWSENLELGVWVSGQRYAYRKNKLSPDRIERLEAIGFDWNRLDSRWEQRFMELKGYKAAHDDCNVPQGWPENPQLGLWVGTLRLNYKKNTLSPDQIERLEAIGFKWNRLDSLWEQKFSELQNYKAAQGDCNVPRNYPENPQLANWVSNQKTNYRKNKLSPDQIERLEAIGFDWNPIDSQWEQKFSELQSYKDVHGDCNVPDNCPENPALGNWVSNQKTNHRKNKLSPDQIERLEAIGFDWNPIDSQWEQRFMELKGYKAAHDDCNVPQRWPENPQLGLWVGTLRLNYKKNKLSPDQIERLEAIGFDWNRLDSRWEQRFMELKGYKAAQGDCNVPGNCPENPALGNWVSNQKTNYRKNTLSPDQIERLEAIGFDWNPIDSQWEQRFSELQSYKDVHGDCNVPDNCPENPALGNWVSNQKTNYRKNTLSAGRIERLEAIGLDWNPMDSQWEQRFSELQSYKDVHGDCNVPRNYPENPQLANWVKYQRDAYKMNKLSPDRVERFEAIGIKWKGRTNK